MPRVKNREVLAKTVQVAVGGMLPGPFAYAERWDEAKKTYAGLVIDHAAVAQIVIDSESVIIQPDVAEANRPKSSVVTGGEFDGSVGTPQTPGGGPTGTPPAARGPIIEKNPTRFSGTVMISSERPARVIHQIVEAIVEQLTTMADSEVPLGLEIDAEVPSDLDRTKVRTLIENATTLGCIEKNIQ